MANQKANSRIDFSNVNRVQKQISFSIKSGFFHEIRALTTLAWPKAKTRASKNEPFQGSQPVHLEACLLHSRSRRHPPPKLEKHPSLPDRRAEGGRRGKEGRRSESCRDPRSNCRARVFLFAFFSCGLLFEVKELKLCHCWGPPRNGDRLADGPSTRCVQLATDPAHFCTTGEIRTKSSSGPRVEEGGASLG